MQNLKIHCSFLPLKTKPVLFGRQKQLILSSLPRTADIDISYQTEGLREGEGRERFRDKALESLRFDLWKASVEEDK